MRVQDRHEAPLMTTREAARLLGCTPRTVIRHVESGDLRGVRLGERGRWRVLRRHVDELVRAGPVQSAYGVRDGREPSPKEAA